MSNSYKTIEVEEIFSEDGNLCYNATVIVSATVVEGSYSYNAPSSDDYFGYYDIDEVEIEAWDCFDEEGNEIQVEKLPADIKEAIIEAAEKLADSEPFEIEEPDYNY